jgi:hypothetical protein
LFPSGKVASNLFSPTLSINESAARLYFEKVVVKNVKSTDQEYPQGIDTLQVNEGRQLSAERFQEAAAAFEGKV